MIEGMIYFDTRPTRTRFTRRLAIPLAIAATIAIAFASVVAVAPSARATQVKAVASAKEFDPGNIVSDAVFFDGDALSASQVQEFLEARVPRCYTASGGPTCLRNHMQATPTMAADAYCKKYTGSTNESAASIIAKVGAACNVSQKALIVLLEKEQSLITAGRSSSGNFPTLTKYLHATGFACTDTAPCDELYGGFFNQIYYGARQYQRYVNSSVYSWRTLGKNTIYYNPKKTCGSVTVNIRNKATLGLYFYTPYAPNAKALANLYGTGDSCSSYGNRNFYRIFTDWFGSSQIPVTGRIQQTWIAQGSHAGALGRPKAAAQCSASNYCVQKFQGGYVASTKRGTSFVMSNSAVSAAWLASYGTNGALRWPYSKAKCTTSGCVQKFTGGYVTTTSSGNAQVITGEIAKKWKALGGTKSALGMATGAMKCTAKGDCRQKFIGGVLAAPGGQAVQVVTADIAKAWKKAAIRKAVGYPKASQKCSTIKVKSGKKTVKVRACRQSFTKGWVVSRAGATTRTVTSTMAKAWSKNRSKVGYPTSNTSCKTARGVTTCKQKFTKKRITIKGKRVTISKL
ncbi:LGFP repeat-containing protein [Rarobacter incanus]|nr:hypothetical protein [Rarobacter incanus]